MNIFQKMYCRVFQTIFKIAIPILPYREPKIINSISEAPTELEQAGVDNVLIITDKTLHSLGMLEPLKACLSERGIIYTVYDNTVANPTIENVEQARVSYIENGCNGLIGFGGGSSIDCAKAVGARIAKPKKPIPKMRGILKIMKKIPYLAAIPTTSGTGSEVTLATVITDGVSDYKFPINDFCLIPRLAVLDVENTKSLPPKMTSTTGMDALTHAIEAYIGRSSTKSTRKDATEAVKLIFENLETAYNEPQNTEAREKMLRASFLAGRAFSKSYVGYVHAVAHSLGGKYNIPHGLANAVILPIVLEEYGKCAYKKLHRLAIFAGVSTNEETHEQGAIKLICAIRKMNERMDIPSTLEGIAYDDIDEMARHASKEANPLYPVPRLMNARELRKIYIEVSGK